MAAADLSAVAEGARRLGLADQPLCVHASLRSFGWIEGGADAVLDGLLMAGCTVLVPTFTGLEVPGPVGARPLRNARDYGRSPWPEERRAGDRVYTPETNEVGASMGAVPRALLARPERRRGLSPLNSFAALGPLADRLIAGQRPLDVYAPLRALGELDGYVLLMGVGLNRMTLIHLAEQVAGRELFRRWARAPDGGVVECEVGSCSDGFPKLETVLGPLARETTVGQSRWQAFPAARTVEAAAAAIRAEPEITRCDRPDCHRCDDAIAGGPLLDQRV